MAGAPASKARNMLEGLVRDGSFKWLLGKRNSFDLDFEEIETSPSAGGNWIPELSSIANIVVLRCSKILEKSSSELQECFNREASDTIKHPSRYARNFLEYCCFQALAVSTQATNYLSDKTFRRLSYDMMLAWEAPAAASQPLLNNVDEDVSVGLEAFCRIAPAVPIIANIIISENLFAVLSSATDGRLQFFTYDKYLNGLERAIRKLKNNSESSLLSAIRSTREEKILEVDGTVTTQPVLEHVGISTWPGRLILTDHALYFEAHRVVSFDKPKRYDLAEDLKQVVKPELTGPWGTRLFDKAVFYSSESIPEPVVMEFPELKGHARRDYWLAIIREILCVHKFIRKYNVKGISRDEALWKAVLGILRLEAVVDMGFTTSVQHETLLMFNLCDQLPGGDVILETIASMSNLRESGDNNSKAESGMHSVSALEIVSNLGYVFGSSSNTSSESRLVVGEISVGQMTPLERAVQESKNDYKKVVSARATVNGVKVDGVDTNLAVMKELLFPMNELRKSLHSLACWDDQWKSLGFCLIFSYIIYREWIGYVVAVTLLFISAFLFINRSFNQGRPVDEVKVIAPPPMNTMEQLLAVQNAITQAEQVIQDGNIILLKLRGLLLSIFPQATEKFALALVSAALVLAVLPGKYIVLLGFLEIFTRLSPPRKASTERCSRRLREWWFSIPAAPVVLERDKEEKKKK